MGECVILEDGVQDFLLPVVVGERLELLIQGSEHVMRFVRMLSAFLVFGERKSFIIRSEERYARESMYKQCVGSKGDICSMAWQHLLMAGVIQEVDVIFVVVNKPDELRVAANHASVSTTLNNAIGGTYCSSALRAS